MSPCCPSYGAQGKVVAYERSLAPERLDALNRNKHIGEMIGAWAGRRAEEELTRDFNRMLVDQLWKIWDKSKEEGRASELVDHSDQDFDDPVQAEAETRASGDVGLHSPKVRGQMVSGSGGIWLPTGSWSRHSASGCSMPERASLRQALGECLDHHWNQTLTPADQSSQASSFRPSVQRR